MAAPTVDGLYRETSKGRLSSSIVRENGSFLTTNTKLVSKPSDKCQSKHVHADDIEAKGTRWHGKRTSQVSRRLLKSLTFKPGIGGLVSMLAERSKDGHENVIVDLCQTQVDSGRSRLVKRPVRLLPLQSRCAALRWHTSTSRTACQRRQHELPVARKRCSFCVHTVRFLASQEEKKNLLGSKSLRELPGKTPEDCAKERLETERGLLRIGVLCTNLRKLWFGAPESGRYWRLSVKRGPWLTGGLRTNLWLKKGDDCRSDYSAPVRQ